ncbi:MAG: LPS export ABC transporter permease LptG [Hyphomonadaceae bacterium]|nr:LPS export ABC transporter permease LptG [Hyphomonadaceae bacterium]
MQFLSSALGLYLLRNSAFGVAIAFAAVLASILLVDLVEEMRTIGARIDLPLLAASRLTLMKTPMLIEQTLPFIILAGVMIGVIRLNRTSELTAMRASGVSAWRFLAPSTIGAALLGVLVIGGLNPIAARLFDAYEKAEAELLAGTPQAPAQRNGVWIRQGDDNGQVVIQARALDVQSARLTDATFFFYDYDGRDLKFARRIRAESADLRPGFWQLNTLVEVAVGEAPQREAHLAIPTTLDPTELLDRFVNPATLSFWQLPRFISEARDAGLAPVRYEIKWQTQLAYPLMLAAMAALGAVFSLRLHRMGGVAAWGAVGVGLGLLLYFLSQVAAAFAVTQAVPPLVAAWSAPLSGLFTALAIVAFTEDG